MANSRSAAYPQASLSCKTYSLSSKMNYFTLTTLKSMLVVSQAIQITLYLSKVSSSLFATSLVSESLAKLSIMI